MPVQVRQNTVSNRDQLQKDAGAGGASCPSYLGGTQPPQPYVGSKHVIAAPQLSVHQKSCSLSNFIRPNISLL